MGITESARERLKRSVKTLASWSAHALSVNVDLFKGLTSATESMISQSSGTAGALIHASMLLASKRA